MLCSPPLRVRPGAADLPIPTPRLLHHRAASPAPSPRPRPRPSSASSSSSRPRTPTPRCAPRGDSTPPRPSRKRWPRSRSRLNRAAATDAQRSAPRVHRRARRGRSPRTFPPAPHAPPRPTRDLTPPRRPAARRGGGRCSPTPPAPTPRGKTARRHSRDREATAARFLSRSTWHSTGDIFFPLERDEPPRRSNEPEARGRFDRDAISRPPRRSRIHPSSATLGARGARSSTLPPPSSLASRRSCPARCPGTRASSTASRASPRSRASARSGAGTWRTSCVTSPRRRSTSRSRTRRCDQLPTYSPKTDFWPFFAVNMASSAVWRARGRSHRVPPGLRAHAPRRRRRLRQGPRVHRPGRLPHQGCRRKFVVPLSPYQGFGVSVQGIIVYRGSYFGLYDTGKGALLNKDSSIVAKFVVAQVATNAAGVLSTRSIRRRPHDDLRRQEALLRNRRRFRQDLAREGAGAFFKGAFSNVLRGVGGALVLIMYDEIKAAHRPARRELRVKKMREGGRPTMGGKPPLFDVVIRAEEGVETIVDPRSTRSPLLVPHSAAVRGRRREKCGRAARAGGYDSSRVPGRLETRSSSRAGVVVPRATRRAPRSGRGDGAGRGRYAARGRPRREREADGSPGARARDAVDPDDARYD